MARNRVPRPSTISGATASGQESEPPRTAAPGEEIAYHVISPSLQRKLCLAYMDGRIGGSYGGKGRPLVRTAKSQTLRGACRPNSCAENDNIQKGNPRHVRSEHSNGIVQGYQHQNWDRLHDGGCRKGTPRPIPCSPAPTPPTT